MRKLTEQRRVIFVSHSYLLDFFISNNGTQRSLTTNYPDNNNNKDDNSNAHSAGEQPNDRLLRREIWLAEADSSREVVPYIAKNESVIAHP